MKHCPWNLDDKSIANYDIPPGPISNQSDEYRIRSGQFTMILTELLRDAGYHNLIRTLNLTVQINNGLLILEAIVSILLPLTTLWILDLVDELCIIKHKSGENVDLFGV